MISVILYGRNDNYGYNLHKRAALSLNCIAEVLSDDDEILFVDYNTPDDYPTFPEAIADTLTDKAQRLLRIFRVRASTHKILFENKTHLKTIEPVARNVALRRSNPKNKWILSTNTDLIFLPKNGGSLSEAIKKLEDGYYITARFEIPESVWETFPRLDPIATMETTKKLSSAMHLRNVVKGNDYNLYDGPGDYQLMLREDLFEINGFDERMVLGWHVDSNISKRLFMKYGKVGDGMEHVFAFHCDHTRQITAAHKPNAKFNDAFKFVEHLKQAEVLEQANGRWGLVDQPVLELKLDDQYSQHYTNTVLDVLKNEPKRDTVSTYSSNTFNKTTAEPGIVIPFLLDMMICQPRDIRIGWLGDKGDVYELLKNGLKRFGFVNKISDVETGTKITKENFSFVIINFGMPKPVSGTKAATLNAMIFEMVNSFIKNGKDNVGPKFVGINCMHNRFEETMRSYFACGRTPFAPRILHGFAIKTFVDETMEENTIDSASRNGFIKIAAKRSQKENAFKLVRPNFFIQSLRIWLLNNGKYFGRLLILFRLFYRVGRRINNIKQLISNYDFLIQFDIKKQIRVGASKALLFSVIITLCVGGIYFYVG